ncbi:mechanosensitive ion channel [Novosphingobium flavum]|uniref:Mechanosensitive ion channel n=1 Tax=Novosphingobium aerophilum TaxID=2839843 RepID=A0A7X1KDC3_9SPHN|nr:mechanosensitive ion channel domain-containing protein [Novosphingobium aerophilum]MBC2653195.1 mechanosensitive ion channel [Novosphingobium aerophilum]MBC2662557.1 mechanosensitive ion channel [Novosphingobium aerophilum]
MILAHLPDLAAMARQLPAAAVAAGVAIALALLVHLGLFRLLTRVAALSNLDSDEMVVDRLRGPMRWALVALAVELAAESSPLLARLWGAIDRFVIPALLGWIAVRLVRAYALVVDSRARLHEDDLSARSRRTRIAILSRSLRFVIIFVTVALMLLSLPGVRTVGVTLITSAGLAALAVGAAAQPALKSLIAGIQMALTEPIRIDDHVVVEGEGGRVEDIRMTYVVIRTADERRLIVPTAKFLDSSFQNWTRVGGGITGSVVLAVRPGTPIDPIRAAYEAKLAARSEWDRRTCALQVSDARIDFIELKLVMSAAEPVALGKLRLALREEMLEWLRCELPEAVGQPAPTV